MAWSWSSDVARTSSSKLARLLKDISGCRICRDAPVGQPLPHEPRPVLRVSATARIAICGQAPGTRVHASGIPFTDPSGDRLRDWLEIGPDIFYDTARIAIVPMGFCFPGLDAKGGDRPPRRECAPAWRDRVFGHLDRIELILLVGQYAQAWHLGGARRDTLTDTVRNWRAYFEAPAQPQCIPLPHPSWRNNAWIKANPFFEKELLPALRSRVAQILDI